jgi:hypothetical protein
MDTTWEDKLRVVGECLRLAEAAKDDVVKCGHLNDACRGLLGVVNELAAQVLPRAVDPGVDG